MLHILATLLALLAIGFLYVIARTLETVAQTNVSLLDLSMSDMARRNPDEVTDEIEKLAKETLMGYQKKLRWNHWLLRLLVIAVLAVAFVWISA